MQFYRGLHHFAVPWMCFSLDVLFSSVVYGTVMNNHKAPWGYSIIRKKRSLILSWLPESSGRVYSGTTIYSSMFYFLTYGQDTTIAEDTRIASFPSLFLFFTVLLFLSPFSISHWDQPSSQILSSLNFWRRWNFLLDLHQLLDKVPLDVPNW